MTTNCDELENFVGKYGFKMAVIDDISDKAEIESKIMIAGNGAHSVDFDGKPKKGTDKPEEEMTDSKGDGFMCKASSEMVMEACPECKGDCAPASYKQAEIEDEYESHGIELGINETKVLVLLEDLSDEKFDDLYRENMDEESAEELKVLFDVGFAFARRALTNRRRKKRRRFRLFKDGEPEDIELKVAPCWDGYVQVGMKKGKRGKMVPNCVPEGQQKSAFFNEETKSVKKKLRDPKGGLTAAGRAHFKKTEGANLKPGVKGAADTPEKMRRKGSFLTRFFTNPSGPMKDEKGRPTRLALSAAAWGEPVPQNAGDAAALAAKGRRMLERYENAKKKKNN